MAEENAPLLSDEKIVFFFLVFCNYRTFKYVYAQLRMFMRVLAASAVHIKLTQLFLSYFHIIISRYLLVAINW